jgi:hypothetical protein
MLVYPMAKPISDVAEGLFAAPAGIAAGLA